jgi:hypothetical protein
MFLRNVGAHLVPASAGGRYVTLKRRGISLWPTSAGLLIGLLLRSESGDDILLRNVGLPELHGVTSQSTVVFKITTVRY